MSEFIGARISLISKSNIRYSGTLHNISSEDSTVSLENVTSFGTEDRKTGDEFIAPSQQVYEYIVFRGSDVKDLRIEESPAPKPVPAAMPNDPAILGVSLTSTDFPSYLSSKPPGAYMMNYFRMKNISCLNCANKPHVDISVAFLLIWLKPVAFLFTPAPRCTF